MVNDRSAQRLTRLVARMIDERRELHQVVSEAENTLRRFADSEPDRLELRGAADICADIYTGIERTFQYVAEEIDGGAPTTSDWHRRLLDDMSIALPDLRPALISDSSRQTLNKLRGFRHLARHQYGHHLHWPGTRANLESAVDIWPQLDAELGSFIDFLCETIKQLEDPS